MHLHCVGLGPTVGRQKGQSMLRRVLNKLTFQMHPQVFPAHSKTQTYQAVTSVTEASTLANLVPFVTSTIPNTKSI